MGLEWKKREDKTGNVSEPFGDVAANQFIWEIAA
jgi:hypothetical protein